MHKLITLCFLASFSLGIADAQFKIRLDAENVYLGHKDFEIIEVQDWRSEKNLLGVVYRTINNTPKVAVLDGKAEEKIFRMIQSGGSPNKVVIGIRKLNIKEVIKATSEFGYSEVELHAALKLEEGYADLGTYRYTSKYSGMDVTGKHAKNIAVALRGALDQISLADLSTEIVSLVDLQNQRKAVKWSNLPVIDLSEIRNGLFLSFSSLKKNKPDTVLDFKINGRKKPALYFKNEKGKFKVISETTYFLAVNDEGVYIGFDHFYYQTRFHNGKWVFIGPTRSDNAAINNALLAGGLVGGVIVGTATKDQYLYQINTIDGSIKAITKIR